MKTHHDNDLIIEQACRALNNLACKTDNNKVAIAAAGGIVVRIAALEHQLSNPSSPP